MNLLRTIPLLVLSSLLVACGKDSAEQPAPAAESPTASAIRSETVHEFKIGELQAFALKDADFAFPNDSKIVATNRTPEDVAKLLEAASLPSAQLELSVQPLLINAGDSVVLFDTGTGAGGGENGGKLEASMREAGVDPASVTDIFISHLHFDHVGGLVDASGALRFPNATIRMSADEWEALQQSAAGNEGNAALVKAITSKVDTFAPGADVLPHVKAVDIKGHTPGHSGYLISSGDQSLLYIGDMAHHYIVSVQEPDWTIQFDSDAPTAQESRKTLIADSATKGQRIYAVHFPFPGLGQFRQDGEKFVWQAEGE